MSADAEAVPPRTAAYAEHLMRPVTDVAGRAAGGEIVSVVLFLVLIGAGLSALWIWRRAAAGTTEPDAAADLRAIRAEMSVLSSRVDSGLRRVHERIDDLQRDAAPRDSIASLRQSVDQLYAVLISNRGAAE